MPTVPINALEDFMGEEVVDKEGNPVGTFACYWEREEKSALLLGVDLPGQSGHTHIVPAQGARFNERQSYVQVLFPKEKIAAAPSLECGCEMDDAFETRIWAFYGLSAPHPVATNPLAQKAEVARQQLRRINRCETPRSPKAPAPDASLTPAAEANPPEPGAAH